LSPGHRVLSGIGRKLFLHFDRCLVMHNPLTGYQMIGMTTIGRIDPRIFAGFAATYILWGATFLAVAVALVAIPPFLLMGSRSLVGGLVLLGYAWHSGARPPARLWLAAAGCGLLLFVGCHGLMAVAQQRVPSGVTAMIMATIPFWVAILGVVLPTSKPTRLLTLVVLIPGIAGVALIAWDPGGAAGSGASYFDLGLLIVSAFFWALGSILLERSNSQQVSALAMSAMALIAGGAALLVVSAASGEFSRFSFGALSWSSVLGWAYLVLAGTIVAFGSYVWLLERVSPTLVATYTFVNPVIAVLLGWAVLGETFALTTLAGGGLVVISIIALLALEGRAAARKEPRDRSADDAQDLRQAPACG
jgi:drug/metabolite transporter (DMT)-like permease